ncbi:MAG: winged helix-turn-helix domain-containing protein [Desulfobacterales bacterium]|nr:winged helix-turn-helix domain-containing protein [Desulfobacterales bacterium]MDD3082753.1 winged helix-turn-helix domain-containing protein [Desulfobacterales bacterium]MDD3951540.1 winged helix-turn-helix domain-containing protein [Desulfobacterales bacterium]MDD4463419.1 winged helix-turn-helix domain-containing protein [Desulfobacterales bacterium]
MARIAQHEALEIEAAKKVAAEAKTLTQLRQSQAVLIPALTGATLGVTAEILGLGQNRVCVLRRQFRASKGRPVEAGEKRGGRRRQLMSVEEEKAFLAPWIEKAGQGGVLVIPPIHAAFEREVKRKVTKSTVYRLLARHGWRKVTPDTHHPKSDPEVQEAFKKTSRLFWRRK